MYLTQILIDKTRTRPLKLWDNYGWHRALWHLFPDKNGKERNFLFRVDNLRTQFKTLLLSEERPEKQPWGEISWDTKSVSSDFLSHSIYRFQVRANPTMKKTFENGNKKRIGIYQETLLNDWILRKADQGGFEIDPRYLNIGGAMDESFWIPDKKQNGMHVSVDFKGILRVIDYPLFEKTFSEGIGSAKAFGYGLLMLQPVQ